VPDMRAYLATPESDVPTPTTRPVPEPNEGEVLVRVQAAALNNGDLSPVTEPRIPGFDFAGEVTAVGAAGDRGLIGHRVMGVAEGAFAEYLTANHRHLLPVPPNLDSAAAASLPTGLGTEYGATRCAGVRLGDTVLITAAAAGIALLGLQVVRLLGAGTVIGTTRNPDRRDFLTAAGADHVVVGGNDALAEMVRSLTDGEGTDVVLDHIGGDALDEVIQAARLDGSVVSVGRLAGGRADIDLFALARRRVTLRSVSYGLTPPAVIGDLLDGVRADLLPAVADGRLTPQVDSAHPFDQLDQAMARLRSGAAEGKVVLTVG
jgi:NADPH:quinone reductase